MGIGFANVQNFHVKFLANQIYPKVNKFLDDIYGEPLPNHTQCYVDKDAQDKLKPNNELSKIIHMNLVQNLILPLATQTPDATSIVPIINQAPLKIKIGLHSYCLLKTSMMDALQNALNKRLDYIKIYIGTAHIFFNESIPLNYLDWTLFSTTAFPAQALPQAPATIADLTAALSNIQPLSAQDLVQAIATAIP